MIFCQTWRRTPECHKWFSSLQRATPFNFGNTYGCRAVPKAAPLYSLPTKNSKFDILFLAQNCFMVPQNAVNHGQNSLSEMLYWVRQGNIITLVYPFGRSKPYVLWNSGRDLYQRLTVSCFKVGPLSRVLGKTKKQWIRWSFEIFQVIFGQIFEEIQVYPSWTGLFSWNVAC